MKWETGEEWKGGREECRQIRRKVGKEKREFLDTLRQPLKQYFRLKEV